jgi:FkbM family methyltransferase
MKISRLAIAGVLTAVASLGYLYVTDPGRLRQIYLCVTQAKSIPACYRGGNIDFVANIDGILYEGNLGNSIDNDIFYHGAYEKHILYFLRDVMRVAYANQGTFLDVGANTGLYSLFVSRYVSAVHAFEPWQPVLARFRRMVDLNYIKNIVIHPVGLGDENARKSFYQPPPENLGTGSFVKEFTDKNSYAGEYEIRIGDDVLEKEGVKSAVVIKMDIEGYEKLALNGLRRTLWRDRPVVHVELTIDPRSPLSIKSLNELRALFPENYAFLFFTGESDDKAGRYSLAPFEAFEGTVRFDHQSQVDIVAYPIERRDQIPLRGPKS